MSSFITGKELEDKIGDIIFTAKKILLIVSPFIKLDDYFKKLFDKHEHSHDLSIIIIFGKNEGKAYKSLSKKDFEYFQKFKNITIIYIPSLHGKYYGNEDKGIITSINLYDKSFENNIEFGFFSESSIMDKLGSGVDKNAWDFCNKLANENDVVYANRPVYKLKFLDFLKEVVGSETIIDQIDALIKGKKLDPRRLSELPRFIEPNNTPLSQKPEREYYGSKEEEKAVSIYQPKQYFKENNNTAYCIRCSKNIPFNVNRPLCDYCYQSWAQWGDENYGEQFCHSTGERSYGRTSKKNPILQKFTS